MATIYSSKYREFRIVKNIYLNKKEEFFIEIKNKNWLSFWKRYGYDIAGGMDLVSWFEPSYDSESTAERIITQLIDIDNSSIILKTEIL